MNASAGCRSPGTSRWSPTGRPTSPAAWPRYWDLEDPVRAADLTALLADEYSRFVIHPDKVSRYTY
ncbi:hypothetical protein GCM10023192_88140 [Amycolatopsis samaneae]